MGANADLGLPFDKMQKVIVACDVDGTLIDEQHNAYDDIVMLVRTLARFKNVKLVIWSGGGKKYAEGVGRMLGLDDVVWRYASKTEYKELAYQTPIIAIDDIQDTAIGDINLIVRNK